MRKHTYYRNVRFDAATFGAAEKQFRGLVGGKIDHHSLEVDFPDGLWSFDTFEEFLAAVSQGTSDVHFRLATYIPGKDYRLEFETQPEQRISLAVQAPTREDIARLLQQRTSSLLASSAGFMRYRAGGLMR